MSKREYPRLEKGVVIYRPEDDPAVQRAGQKQAPKKKAPKKAAAKKSADGPSDQ